MDKFIITESHLTLLKNAFVGWDGCEYGAPAIDCKRPYGNSDVELDIAELLGWEYSEDGLDDDMSELASKIHKETKTVLQICLVTGEFKTGVYVKTDKYDNTSWVRKV